MDGFFFACFFFDCSNMEIYWLNAFTNELEKYEIINFSLYFVRVLTRAFITLPDIK